MVTGKLQREGEVTHVIVQRCYNLSHLLVDLIASPEDVSNVSTTSRADENDGEDFHNKDRRGKAKRVIQAELFPEAGNFK